MALSSKGRRAISLAQRKRWAKFRTTGKPKQVKARKPYKTRREVLDAWKTLDRYIKRHAT